MDASDLILDLAQKAIHHFLNTGSTLACPEPLPRELTTPAGAFICLKKHGRLRGCVGTVQPVTPTLAEEIIRNAIQAATQDPRFDPVTIGEWPEIDCSVDVLCEEEPVESLDQLDPAKYGLIVRSGKRQGVLLPDIEGVKTVKRQIEVCRQKAGIKPGDPESLFRFQVRRYQKKTG